MKNRWLAAPLAVLVLVVAVMATGREPVAAAAETDPSAVNIYLKLGDSRGEIQGECQNASHRKEIDILSHSYGLTAAASTGSGGGGAAAGRASFEDVVLTKHFDKASPKLHEACCQGKTFTTAVLTFTRTAGGNELKYLTITLNEVMVTELSHSLGEGQAAMLERVALSFAKIKMEYTEYVNGKAAGTVNSGWDLKTNKLY